jgi:hypothetical protein
MKIAMYKGPPDDFWHTVGHKGTCLWTRSRYSHCELVFGDAPVGGKHLCASSSARDGGVRFKRIDLASGRWDVYELPGYDEFDEAYARQWFNDNDAAKYDHFALLWFILPISAFDRSKRFFCSEALAAALGMRHPHKQHPQRLLDAALKA